MWMLKNQLFRNHYLLKSWRANWKTWMHLKKINWNFYYFKQKPILNEQKSNLSPALSGSTTNTERYIRLKLNRIIENSSYPSFILLQTWTQTHKWCPPILSMLRISSTNLTLKSIWKPPKNSKWRNPTQNDYDT